MERLAQEIDFSGVVSVVEKDTTVYEMAFGYADRSNGIKNTLRTRFGMASGSKAFTALAIGKLIQEGRLSFDSKAVDCIPTTLPNVSRDVTIKHLLTHTSGVGDYYDEEEVNDFESFFVDIPWYELRGPRDYIPLFIEKPMKFSPGDRFSYSNGGYILLGIIIEEISGISYQMFVEKSVFGPLGMNDSGFFAMDELPERTAFGYVKKGNGWRTNIYNLPILGASDGGAFTTVDDMKVFWRGLLAYRLLSRDLSELFLGPNMPVGPPEKHQFYGHGFWMFKVSLGKFVHYLEGCDAGVSFQSLFLPWRGLIATILSNTTDGAWPLVRTLQEHLMT
jgi:CubicO group peptidase (beta-lactamase class C family)